MDEKLRVYNLVNDYFRNPFINSKIAYPFETLNDEEDLKKTKSNIMIDFLLFKLKVVYTANTIMELEGDSIKVLLQIKPSIEQLIIDFKQKRKCIRNINPTFVYKFKIFNRKDFNTSSIQPNPLIKEKDHDFVVDLAGFEVSEIYDLFRFENFNEEELERFRELVSKHAEGFNLVFGDYSTYPKYNFSKDEKEVSLVFPEKEVFSWKSVQ
jgi:hypothetical protein